MKYKWGAARLGVEIANRQTYHRYPPPPPPASRPPAPVHNFQSSICVSEGNLFN